MSRWNQESPWLVQKWDQTTALTETRALRVLAYVEDRELPFCDKVRAAAFVFPDWTHLQIRRYLNGKGVRCTEPMVRNVLSDFNLWPEQRSNLRKQNSCATCGLPMKPEFAGQEICTCR